MDTPISELPSGEQGWVLDALRDVLSETVPETARRKRRDLVERLRPEHPQVAGWLEEDGSEAEDGGQHPILKDLPCSPDRLAGVKDATVLIKYGGNAMVDETVKQGVIADICALKSVGAVPVVVHGGGPAISELLGKVGVRSLFIEGHRKTDRNTMRYVEMALSGEVNSGIVKLFSLHGFKAAGLSGKDGGLVTAEKRIHKVREGGALHRSDLGQVGDVTAVNPHLVETLLQGDYIPVIAPIGVGADLEDYNINADMFAGHMAAALGAQAYVALTDVDGIFIDREVPETLIPELAAHAAREEIGRIVQGGMIPKVESCLIALEGGASAAHIVNGMAEHALLRALLTDEQVGTTIIKEEG